MYATGVKASLADQTQRKEQQNLVDQRLARMGPVTGSPMEVLFHFRSSCAEGCVLAFCVLKPMLVAHVN